MTRALRAFNKGRLRIWLIHHGQEAKNAAYLVAIVSAFLTVSHFDYQDAIAAEKSARETVAEELRQERLARTLPRTTFVIEAATPAEAQRKLAIVAGDADADRYRIWSVTK